MNDAYWDAVVDRLRGIRGIEREPGLTDKEVDAIERRCSFQFPPDLLMFLQRIYPLGRPIPDNPHVIMAGGSFPDWRNAPGNYLEQRFEAVLNGIFFDIEHGFWNSAWGAKPADVADACDIARRELAKAPALIPLFAHRFMPNEPLLAGNPVFSFHQTDIIYYGFDLADYFTREFGAPRPSWASASPRVIRVWTDSLDWRNDEFWPARS
ncbi:MAG: hypothetical protein ACR2M3_06710 [Thermomicrobiales bacterium]